MNSEELEVSLRTEFENYLKSALAEMKQEISQLQEKVTTEIERHKSQLDDVFEVALSNFEKEREFDDSFKESVVEHLRLSRDEGAQITAMAIAKAEELEKETAPPAAPVVGIGIKEIHQAVNEISSKTTQSEILKTLVHHSTGFAPRGVFFIVKNEHLVGWRVFGKEKGSAEEKVREVFLPISANSVLSESVKSLATVDNSSGGLADDADVLQKLGFGAPDKIVAIPLVARGRGVAVLYADYGNEGGDVNVEALETLVRVAGLTVEVLASAKTTGKKSSKKSEVAVVEEDLKSTETTETYEAVEPASETVESFVSQPIVEHSFDSAGFIVPTVVEEVVETPSYTEETSQFVEDDSQIEETRPSEVVTEFEAVSDVVPTESEAITEPQAEFETVETSFEPTAEFETAPPEPLPEFETFATEPQTEFETVATEPQVEFETFAPEPQIEDEEKYPAFETTSWSPNTETTPGFSAQEFAQNFAKETDPAEYAKEVSYEVPAETTTAPTQEYELETSNSYQEVPTEEFVPTKEQTYGSFELENGKTEMAEVTQPISTPPVKSRLSERNVDLPIEVTEDERRLHNDARRFARLLVSEIKLYNEQKVKEGRDSSDLYERLKEAIDRSREMYDKRVQPPVAAKFDYFHYEVVNTLAEGDDNKLGTGYPGSNV